MWNTDCMQKNWMQKLLKRGISEWKWFIYCFIIYYRKRVNFHQNVQLMIIIFCIQFNSCVWAVNFYILLNSFHWQNINPVNCSQYSHFTSLMKFSFVQAQIYSIEMTNFTVWMHLQLAPLNFVAIFGVVVIRNVESFVTLFGVFLLKKFNMHGWKMVENKSEFGVPHTTNWHFYSNLAVFSIHVAYAMHTNGMQNACFECFLPMGFHASLLLHLLCAIYLTKQLMHVKLFLGKYH